jgi:predicted naringenin-chalcone synthase
VADIAHWVIHPGGPRIIDAVQAAVALTDEDTALSRSVLHDYGNMSSPTVLFILDRLRHQTGNLHGPALMLGFGPGLMAEAALLHR